ncbi:MAG: flagellar motor switch protein FliN [Hyphomicrobiaceae bacterium]|nr:flagellar motor switch protein FliN [Hyphomicrobiaceae bacterium]
MNTIDTLDVEISVVLGSAVMPIHQLLRMGRGAVIELDTGQDDQVLLLANNIPVAMAEVVVNGDKIAVEIKEILKRVAA